MNGHNKQDIAIYIATHNQRVESDDKSWIPIQTGAALSKNDFCNVKDNIGFNISDRNRSFCELTALYWIWKNDAHAVVGLNHYRRKFLIETGDVKGILDGNDIIVPAPYFFRHSLREEYRNKHIISDLELLDDIISEQCLSIKTAYENTMASNFLVPYNMFIAKREWVDEYCSWLFPILFRLEQQVDISSRDPYQQRVFGFLSERLFTTYLQAQNWKTYICPVAIPETESALKSIKYLWGIRFNKLYFDLNKK